MIIYKLGKVVSIGKTYIIFETGPSGYVINVGQPETFKLNDEIKLFLYNHKTELTDTLYGFKAFKERVVFTDLMTINGVGPKTSMVIMRAGFEKVINMIISGDASALAKLPWIGSRTAAQIVYDFKDKYTLIYGKKFKKQQYQINELHSALKTLGFKRNQIEDAMLIIDHNKSIEEAIEDAIKVMSNVSAIKA